MSAGVRSQARDIGPLFAGEAGGARQHVAYAAQKPEQT